MKKISINAIYKTGITDNGDMIIYLMSLYGTNKKELIKFLQLPQHKAISFYSFSQATAYIKRLAKNNGFYIDIISSDFNGVLYDINFTDISNETPKTERFYISCLI